MDRHADDRPVPNDDPLQPRRDRPDQRELQRRGFLFVLSAGAVALGSATAWGRSLLLLQKHQGGGDPPPSTTTKSASATHTWSLTWSHTDQSWTRTATSTPPGNGTETRTYVPSETRSETYTYTHYTLDQTLTVQASVTYSFTYVPSDWTVSDTYSWDGSTYTYTRSVPPLTGSTSGSRSVTATYTAPIPGCGNCPPFAFGLESDSNQLDLRTIDGSRDVTDSRSRTGSPYRLALGF
jgi:hypothetical protein